MARPKAQLRLGAFFNPTGHHVASWRHPERAGRRRHQFQALRRDRADRRARQVRHGVLRRQHRRARGQHGGAVALGAVHRQLRADHADLGARRGDQPHRADLHRLDQLQRAVPRRAQVRLARPHQRRPRRLEPRHLGHARTRPYNFNRDAHYGHAERYERANEFAEVVTALWDSWDDDAFVRDKESGPVLRPGEDAFPQSQGKALQGARPAQHPAPAAGPSGDRAGRHLRRRHGRGGALRRGDLQRQPDDGVLPGLLQGGEDARAGQVRPQPRPSQGDAGARAAMSAAPRRRRRRSTTTRIR